jgi:sister chromatid cohesion protein PDS5
MPAVTRKRANSPQEAHEETEEEKSEAEMDVEEHGAQNGQTRLRFHESLSWRAGRAIPLAELLRRLETLAKELHDLEQEEVERDSLLSVAKELASQQLLAHKDRGVKAWTACCLVDILRLCAPDAPYTGKELKVGLLLLSEPHETLTSSRKFSLSSSSQFSPRSPILPTHTTRNTSTS